MTTTATATATAANTKSGDAAPTLMDMDAYMLMPTQASPLPAGKLDGALDDAVAVSTPIPGGAPPCAMPGWFPPGSEQAHIWGAASYPSGQSPYRWWVDEAEEEARPLKRAIEKEMVAAPEEEEEMEEGEVSPLAEEEEAVERAAEEEVIDVDAESAPKRVRVYFSGEKMWVGAPKPKARKAAKKPKALRMRLPESGTSLAEGARVYGLVGAKATERRRLIEAARELRGASAGWAKAIEETLNELRDAQAPLLSFGRGAGDDLDLRRGGAGVAKHADAIMAALDHLRAPHNAAAAAERGLLVRWPECLPRGVLRCSGLHAYLNAWAEDRPSPPR